MITTDANGGKATTDTNSAKITFSHYKALNSNPLIFLDENKKFSPQYPAEIHKICTDLDITPKLYEFDSLAGGWYMVVWST